METAHNREAEGHSRLSRVLWTFARHQVKSHLQYQIQHTDITPEEKQQYLSTLGLLKENPSAVDIDIFARFFIQSLNINVNGHILDNNDNALSSTMLPENLIQQLLSKDQGALILGQHAAFLEPFIIFDALKQLGLNPIMVGIDIHGPTQITDVLLQVTPSKYGRDASNKPNLLWRFLGARPHAKTQEEYRQENLKSLQKAADYLRNKRIVVIFPTSNADISTTTWHPGVGRVLHFLMDKKSDKSNPMVNVLMYQHSTQSFRELAEHILRTNLARFLGRPLPSPYPLTFTWAPPTSVNEIINVANPTDSNPERITQALQNLYCKTFSK